MDWSDYEVDGQLSIFDLIESENKVFNPLEALALRGTGFRDGMKRVKAYFNENHTITEKAKFLKRNTDKVVLVVLQESVATYTIWTLLAMVTRTLDLHIAIKTLM